MRISNNKIYMYPRFGKRLIDFIAALGGLVVLSPVLVILMLLIRMKLGSPVFFRQQRPGLNGEPFYLVKFRSMTDARGPDGELLPDQHRLTWFSGFLRASSLDELPELWNVLKGEMSLVGPRPLLMEYLPYYTERERIRHSVRPGITGLAQTSGRNLLGWEERLELDAQYVESISLLNDLRILWKTLAKVLHRSDVVVVPANKGMKLSAWRERQRKDG